MCPEPWGRLSYMLVPQAALKNTPTSHSLLLLPRQNKVMLWLLTPHPTPTHWAVPTLGSGVNSGHLPCVPVRTSWGLLSLPHRLSEVRHAQPITVSLLPSPATEFQAETHTWPASLYFPFLLLRWSLCSPAGTMM